MSDSVRNGRAASPSGAGAAPAAGPQQDGFKAHLWRLVQQMVLIYAVSSIAKNFFNTQSSPKTPQPAQPATGGSQPVADAHTLPPVTYAPIWPLGSTFDLHAAISTSVFDPYSPQVSKADIGLPRFVWKDIQYGDWAENRKEDYILDIPTSVQNNGSLWLHIFLTLDHASPDPRSSEFDANRIHYIRKPLTRYMKKPRTIVEKLLIGGDKQEEERATKVAEKEGDVWLSYWHPNITLTLVSDAGNIPTQQLTGPTARYYTLHPHQRDATGTTGFYYPVIFPNDFWLLRGHMTPINTTTPSLPLHISFYAISNMKFQLFAAFSQGFDEAANKGAGTSADLDEIKRMLIETNIWLLITTAVVSVLHMLFEMMAFTSDVAHWRQKKELVGVSVRTILVNVFVQLITSLYLWDNAEETSWMVIFTQFIGVAIEAWKITKAVNIELVPAPGAILLFKLKITDKHVLSEDEKKTKEYDQLAFRYVSYVAIPVLAVYTVYSLMYSTYKGWYSFILSTLTSFVYMFGFAQLVPQLIINYKLKSVAHMPWKAMVYKTLSTVVDDFFAFIIKMPWLHRLACFRDDVVFLILLYQRWIYRVDMRRTNEYGQVGEREIEERKVVAGSNKKE